MDGPNPERVYIQVGMLTSDVSKANSKDACSFCGKKKTSNCRLRSKRTVQYEDGPSTASVQSVVLCHGCADDVSDYFEARADQPDSDTDESPFSEADAEAILSRVEQNQELVLDFGIGYGVRSIDGQWKLAHMPLPGPPQVTEMERAEVIAEILDAPRVTVKRLDLKIWSKFGSMLDSLD